MVIKKIPKENDIKIKKKFLWKPTKINNEIRWLEFRNVSYIYLDKKWRIYNYLNEAQIDAMKFFFSILMLVYVTCLLLLMLLFLIDAMKL